MNSDWAYGMQIDFHGKSIYFEKEENLMKAISAHLKYNRLDIATNGNPDKIHIWVQESLKED